jgi:hypothetical protein
MASFTQPDIRHRAGNAACNSRERSIATLVENFSASAALLLQG